jgi:hypothetical protein
VADKGELFMGDDVRDRYYAGQPHLLDLVLHTLDGLQEAIEKQGVPTCDAVALIFAIAEEWHSNNLAAAPEFDLGGAGHA